jgi:hypothetical protein
MRRSGQNRTSAADAAGGRNANLLCLGALLLISLLLHGRALFTARVLLPGEIVAIMGPWGPTARERFPEFRFTQNQMHGPIYEYASWRMYARQRLHQGEVPLWNPHELSGNVLMANSQSAVLYPPNLLLYVLPFWVGINAVTVLHTFLTGMFACFLLRRWKLHPLAAVTGAAVWQLCAVQVCWTEFQTPTAAMCWLPAILLAWTRYVQGGPVFSVGVGGGGAVAMSLLAGHLHFAFYGCVALGVMAACTLRPMGIFRTLRGLACMLAFGSVFSACTLLPVVEMSRLNFRGRNDYAGSVALRLPAENLTTFLLPNILGNPRDYIRVLPDGSPAEGFAYVGRFDFIEYAGYVGVAGLTLALTALLLGLNTRQRTEITPSVRTFGLIGLVGLLMALGTPLCMLFYYGVPGYRQFNATARALCLVDFSLAMLAGAGVHLLVTATEETRRRTYACFAAALGTAAVLMLAVFPGQGLWVGRVFSDKWFGYCLQGLVHGLGMLALTAAAAAAALRYRRMKVGLAVVPALDLLIWSFGFNPATNPGMLEGTTQTTERLKSILPARAVSLETPRRSIKSFIVPNYNCVVGYREVNGADSLHWRTYHQLMERVERAVDPSRTIPFPDPNTVRLTEVNHPVLDMLNVVLVTREPRRLPAHGSDEVLDTEAELTIWRRTTAIGPAWIVRSVRQEKTLSAVLDGVASRNFNPRDGAFVQKSLPLRPVPGAADTVEMTRFSPHRVDYRVSAGASGLLVTSETALPGWRCRVDGRETEILTANAVLRSVVVSDGSHSVEFRYDPASWRLGLFVTLCGVSASIGWWYITRRTTAL